MKETKLFFKVKYGYSVSDQVSISENELDKAIYAQIQGVPIHLGTKYINGKNIIVIEPHYHKYTGWYDYYEPKDGEDWEQIKRDCPNFDGVIENHKMYVNQLMSESKIQLIGKKDWERGVQKIEAPKNPISEFTKELSDKYKI